MMTATPESTSSMCLFMLKTKDLSDQDHCMNIEAMMAPSRTYLKLKKHRTLNASYDKNARIYERELQHAIHSFRGETTLVNRKKQELYAKRVNRTLDNMTSEQQRYVLRRKSFSHSLTEIQNERKTPQLEKASSETTAPSPISRFIGIKNNFHDNRPVEQDFRTRAPSTSVKDNEYQARSRCNSIIAVEKCRKRTESMTSNITPQGMAILKQKTGSENNLNITDNGTRIFQNKNRVISSSIQELYQSPRSQRIKNENFQRRHENLTSADQLNGHIEANTLRKTKENSKSSDVVPERRISDATKLPKLYAPIRTVQTSCGFYTEMSPKTNKKQRMSFSGASGYGARSERPHSLVRKSSSRSNSIAETDEDSLPRKVVAENDRMLIIEETNENGLPESDPTSALSDDDPGEKLKWHIAIDKERRKSQTINLKIQRFLQQQLTFEEGLYHPSARHIQEFYSSYHKAMANRKQKKERCPNIVRSEIVLKQ